MRFVLDASVSLAWFLDKPVPALAMRARKELYAGSSALVPALWIYEMANGLAMVERRGLLSRSFLDRSLQEIETLVTTAISSDDAVAISLRHAFSAASTFRLTAFDAVYLETARKEGLPLATLDRELIAAAKKAGVSLFA